MNARSEIAAVEPAFKAPFARRQRSIVPAWTIFEPFYAPGAKRYVRWAIERAEGTVLGIAELRRMARVPLARRARAQASGLGRRPESDPINLSNQVRSTFGVIEAFS